MIDIESLAAKDLADLIEIETHLRFRPARENFVRDLLEPAEHRRVRSRLDAGEHIASIWMTLRGVTQAQAYADLGRRLLSVRDDRANSLLRACGELPPLPTPRVHVKPLWDKDGRVLTIDGLVCRQIKHSAKNIIAILDAFQRKKWPRRIEDIFADFETRPAAIKILNQGCKYIIFRGADKGIIWERRVAEVTGPTSHRSPRRVSDVDQKSRTKRKPK